MVCENLARKFKPAGFEQPDGSRKSYTKPRPEIQETFDEWINELPEQITNNNAVEEQYTKACELIKSIGEIPYREANSLLIDFKPKTWPQRDAGLFVSACYNQSTEPLAVFDIEAQEIYSIGYRLRRDKILVNHGISGDYFGFFSSGIVANDRETGADFCDKFSGIAIAIKEPEEYGISKRRFLKPEHLNKIPELKKYLKEFSEITKNLKDEESAKRFAGRYGPNPTERMAREIEEVLNEAILRGEYDFWLNDTIRLFLEPDDGG